MIIVHTTYNKYTIGSSSFESVSTASSLVSISPTALENKEATNDSITSHLEMLEFLEINKERKKTVVNACRDYMKTKNRMKTNMVRTRHPRAQMFTVSPKKRLHFILYFFNYYSPTNHILLLLVSSYKLSQERVQRLSQVF